VASTVNPTKFWLGARVGESGGVGARVGEMTNWWRR